MCRVYAVWRFGLCCFASCLAGASDLKLGPSDGFFLIVVPPTYPHSGAPNTCSHMQGGAEAHGVGYRVTMVQGCHPLLTPSLHVLCVSGHSQPMDLPLLPQSLTTPGGPCHHRHPQAPQTSPCSSLSPTGSPPTPGGPQPLDVPTSNCISVLVLGSMGLVKGDICHQGPQPYNEDVSSSRSTVPSAHSL